jgi:hypothetical protein
MIPPTIMNAANTNAIVGVIQFRGDFPAWPKSFRFAPLSDVLVGGHSFDNSEIGWKKTGAQLPLRGDDARVEAGQVQAAMEAGVLDLHTAVHHDLQPGGLCQVCGLLVPGPQLEPDRLGADVDGLLGHAGEVGILAEDLHQIRDLGQIGQGRVDRLAQDLLGRRVDEVDLVRG